MIKFLYRLPFLSKIIKQRDDALGKISALEAERNVLLSKKLNNNEFKDIFLSPWTDSWKDFNFKNFDKIDDLLEKLKFGMDEKSKKVVDVFWEKIVYLIPYNKYKKSFLYKVEDFFTRNELEEQKESIDLTKYKLPDGVDIETPIFSTKNGIVFLPENVISKIESKALIDGGGYIGDSALVFMEYRPSKIFSFEPVDFLYNKLQKTIILNDAQKTIIPVKFGLGEKNKEAKIFGLDSAASLFTEEKSICQVVNITTIDDFVKEQGLEIGLIKLDVEGSESDAINGALETIKKYKPILLISIYHRPEDFFFIKPLIENLNLGYKFMIRKTSPFRVTSETVLIGYVG